MFLNKKATSIVEVIVVLLIITSGVVGMYQIYNNSQRLSSSTGNKITAIQMAKEGIEAMKNIRDTNWILFGVDKKNCWNVFNYNKSCILNPSTLTDISIGSYKVYQDTEKRWKLSKKITSETEFSKENYRNEMRVGLDSNGFFTQTGSIDEIKPLFTREIKISYLEDGKTAGDQGSNEEKMKVISLVQWVDLSSDKPHKVKFESILTNWEK